MGGSCAVLMVAFFFPFDEKPMFDWLPFHRLISYTMNGLQVEIKELLPSHIDLFKLIDNPDFNRFQYYEKTLVPDFQFSDSLRTNNTKWLFVRIDWIDFQFFFELDRILQFLNILRKKVEGMPFQYKVVLPKHQQIQKIMDKLNIPMVTRPNLVKWFKDLGAVRFSLKHCTDKILLSELARQRN